MSKYDHQYEDHICNDRLITGIAENMNLKKSTIQDILHGFGSFIASTIREGSMEGVSIPFLGKIQVKLPYQQYKAYLHSLHPMYKSLLQENCPFNEISEVTPLRGTRKSQLPPIHETI